MGNIKIFSYPIILLNLNIGKYIAIKIKPTNTPTNKLIWPKKLSDRHKKSIARVIGGVDSELVQQILDEIESTTKVVRNPVAYFHDLLSKSKSGEYVPSGAISRSDQRETKKRGEERYEAMKNESIRKADELFAKHARAD